MLPVFMGVFERMDPLNQSLTGDAFIDMVAYCLLLSLGQAILFNCNASSGGLDIVGKIMNKYLQIRLVAVDGKADLQQSSTMQRLLQLKES